MPRKGGVRTCAINRGQSNRQTRALRYVEPGDRSHELLRHGWCRWESLPETGILLIEMAVNGWNRKWLALEVGGGKTRKVSAQALRERWGTCEA